MRFSAALMAGGKSTRMGFDKCLIEVNGVPLWQRQLDLLGSLASEIFVVAPERPAWVLDNATWLKDLVQDQGPIGGLAAALAAAVNQNVIILAVDMPYMSPLFLRQMGTRIMPDSGIVPQIDAQYQPLSAIYNRETLSIIMDQLARGENSLQALSRVLIDRGLLRSFAVNPVERELFSNWNYPTDLTGRGIPGLAH